MNAHATQMRVILATDQLATLAQTARLVEEEQPIVGTATNGLDLLEATVRLDPDRVVLDITAPGLDGFEAARRLQQACCQRRMACRTVHEDADEAKEAIALGVNAYMANRESPLLTRAAPRLAPQRGSNPISQQSSL